VDVEYHRWIPGRTVESHSTQLYSEPRHSSSRKTLAEKVKAQSIPPRLQNANLEWLSSGMPRSRDFDDVYFSRDGGMQESEHVFLRGNSLAERWQTAADRQQRLFVIAELGFGSGLNFLLSWRLWASLAIQGLRLQYIAYEKYPLCRTDLHRALALWPELAEFATALETVYPDHTAGIHRINFSPTISLDLCYGDATALLRIRGSGTDAGVDCWFLDGFSPSKNPQLWSAELIGLIRENSAHSASLSTYSVAGAVRRHLQDAGFSLNKQKGFGSKREMLTATLGGKSVRQGIRNKEAPGQERSKSPWFIYNRLHPARQSAIVIGAGLAGCSTARSLADRGWRVTLVEAADSPAAGASGNPQTVLQIRLANNNTAAAGFYLHAYLFANRHFSQIAAASSLAWNNCGVLRVMAEDANLVFTSAQQAQAFYSPQVLQFLDQQAANAAAGIELNYPGFFLPHAGYLPPRQLCQYYIDHPNIRTLFSQRVTALHRQSDSWRVLEGSEQIASAEVLVLANGIECKEFAQSSAYPLTAVRGQLTEIKASSHSRRLRSVIAGSHFLCPCENDRHSIGASYQPGELDLEPRKNDNMENMLGIRKVFADPDIVGNTVSSSRTGIRCSSQDQLPLIGPLPNRSAFTEQYGALRRNAKTRFTVHGEYWPGLYLNVAHGSYGLASCPLAAELLASIICNESLPVDTLTMDNLNPARFLIRDLKRQRS
jgi:tRNA 5-methylaminomethyl-2-thiouridine biosynthesis bifunctional protein